MMSSAVGTILEIRAGETGRLDSALVACPPELVPSPGQYLMAARGPQAGEPGHDAAPLAAPIFPGAGPIGHAPRDGSGFWAGSPLPPDWVPGLQIHLRGPLGKGFRLPDEARKVALMNVEGQSDSLLLLAVIALRRDCSVVFFGDAGRKAPLPPEIEAFPLESLQDLAGWADYLAVDASMESLQELIGFLRPVLGLVSDTPVDVLVRSEMPCGGLSQCGVCAFPWGKEWLLACEDGPVIRWLGT